MCTSHVTVGSRMVQPFRRTVNVGTCRTQRLRLESIGPSHAPDVELPYRDPAVVRWSTGPSHQRWVRHDRGSRARRHVR